MRLKHFAILPLLLASAAAAETVRIDRDAFMQRVEATLEQRATGAPAD